MIERTPDTIKQLFAEKKAEFDKKYSNRMDNAYLGKVVVKGEPNTEEAKFITTQDTELIEKANERKGSMIPPRPANY